MNNIARKRYHATVIIWFSYTAFLLSLLFLDNQYMWSYELYKLGVLHDIVKGVFLAVFFGGGLLYSLVLVLLMMVCSVWSAHRRSIQLTIRDVALFAVLSVAGHVLLVLTEVLMNHNCTSFCELAPNMIALAPMPLFALLLNHTWVALDVWIQQESLPLFPVAVLGLLVQFTIVALYWLILKISGVLKI